MGGAFETETIRVDGVPVDGVLVSPGESDRLLPTDIALPAGARVEYRLDIPKSYTERLCGQKVEVRGGLYDVADKPAYTTGNTPGEWNRYALAYRLEYGLSDEIRLTALETGIDETGYPVASERTVYEGPAQARMDSGETSGGSARQTDSTETWLFVFPWPEGLDGALPSSLRIAFRGDVLDVVSVDNVDRRGESASVKAVRRG